MGCSWGRTDSVISYRALHFEQGEGIALDGIGVIGPAQNQVLMNFAQYALGQRPQGPKALS